MDLNNMIVRCSDMDEAFEVLRLVETYTDITWVDNQSPIRGGECAWLEEQCLPTNTKIALFFKRFKTNEKIRIYYRNEYMHYSGFIDDLRAELKNPIIINLNDFAMLLRDMDKIIPSKDKLMDFLL